ncbi:MAG: triphosphoribosyl-dephospho-CoA synthase [Planctomycetota bacterium]
MTESRAERLRRCLHAACLAEATAAKVGNVHPGASFADLDFAAFRWAAEHTASELSRLNVSIWQSMDSAVRGSLRHSGTNVHLGIVLLLGPLVATAAEDSRCDAWSGRISDFLGNTGLADGGRILNLIADAMAGGLGRVDAMDVYDRPTDADLLAAMRLAQHRDQIANQYANGYRPFFDDIVPVIAQRVIPLIADFHDDGLGPTKFANHRSVQQAIVAAQIECLGKWPDSLIARKHGTEVAESIRRQAAQIDVNDPRQIQSLDDSLRQPIRINPGTTADLIAASLFVCLWRRNHPSVTATTKSSFHSKPATSHS